MVEHWRWPNCSGLVVVVVGDGGRGQGPVHRVAATATCCRNIMVVLPLVGRDYRSVVVGGSLHVFSHRASGVRALVVAPTNCK